MLSILHRLFARISVPLWRVKGWHRVARAANATFLKLGQTPVQMAQLKDGTRFLVDLRAHTEWHALYSGQYDDFWVKLCQAALREGELFLDVGGNIGIYAARVARARPDIAGTIAFEPFGPNADRLAENVALNQLDGRVELCRYGLSDAAHKATLTLRQDFQSGSSTGNASISISDEADAGYAQVEITLQRLDDIAGHEFTAPVGVIKVDIEGHEDEFYAGGMATIERDRPIIIAEACKTFAQWKNKSLDAVYAPLVAKGFHLLRRPYQAADRLDTFTRLVPFDHFDEMLELDNLVLCPAEKLDRLAHYVAADGA
ncbi:MAG: FkbM family methyltransferase [Sphingomonadaceae bacterium]|nr:FkbM family methyltransferase [Sphingomonadaceae bacterium]